MKEVRLLLLSDELSIADKLRGILGSTVGLPYTIITKKSFADAQGAIDAFPVQIVMADMVHVDAIQLLNHLKQSEFNGALIALFNNEEDMTPTVMTRCPVQDTLCKSRMDPLLVRQVLRFARQRRHSQLLLAREQSLFTELLNNTPDRIYFKDRNSRFLRVNMGMARAFGFKNPDDLRGKSDFDIHAKDRAQDAFNDEQKIIRTGQPLLGKDETEMHADGQMRWVNTLKMPLRNARREIIGTMGISRDITEQKKTQEKLETVIRELRDTQSELIEAEKLRIVGRLAAGVAHEVKNPLNIILMAADTLCEEGIDEDERKELCKEIRTAVNKANNVIFELLDFSAAKELRLDSASLNSVVERAIKLVHHRIVKAKIKVKVELDPNLPEIPMDPQKIEQVLINLIFNAINAMPDGGTIEIQTTLEKIGLEADAAKGPLIERFRIGDQVMTLAVRDNGMGIEKDNLGKVFEPFFTTGPSGKSSGLGLMVTKNIVERHHGVLTLRNRHSGGVEAKVYLHLDPKNSTQ